MSQDRQSPEAEPAASPPHARLAFRVSIVGHRPNRLPQDPAGLGALRGRIAAVLGAVKQEMVDFQATSTDAALYAPGAPLLRAISSLAEGSDRMLAEEALRLGYSLCCPMPFAQAEFEKDFAPDEALEPRSVGRFRALLDRARGGEGLETFELDGERTSDDAKALAYEAAARVVMNQSDLMVIVWDGGESAGRGGTIDTLHEALRYHVPVLWIDAVAPFGWAVVRSEADIPCLDGAGRCMPADIPSTDSEEEGRKIAEAVSLIVREEVSLPTAPPAGLTLVDASEATALDFSEEARVHARDYFAERRWPVNLFFFWKLFRNLVGDRRLAFPRIRTTDFVSAIRAGWPTTTDEAPDAPPRPTLFWVNAAIRPHFAWTDRLADNYADAYRTAFLMSYLLAAVAVLVAVLPRAIGLTDHAKENDGSASPWIMGFGYSELAVLGVILALLLVGLNRRWHERWMEYRVLAEMIRELKFLIPLGGGRPLPRTPTHLAVYGDPAQTWMYWHVRAIARATGLPSVKATPAYLDECLESLAELADDPVRGQRAFHHVNSERYEHLHERLHHATLWVFFITIVAIVVHLGAHLLPKRLGAEALIESHGDWQILASAFLPAFAAALSGINNHGEFLRISKRSRSMAEGFARFANAIGDLRKKLARGDRVSLADVTPLASRMAETMVDEVIDWRVVVLDRPQTAG